VSISSFFKVIGIFVCVSAGHALAQDDAARSADVAQLSQDLRATRAELADSKREIEELRKSVEELRKQVGLGRTAETVPAATVEPTVATADQDVGFLAAKVAEMHQDKVESASKYPVKLSGLILFNSYWNKGVLDIQDLPSFALPSFPGAPVPSVGATFRQTMLGVDVTGPKFFGAQSSGGVEIDFAGGSPTTAFGVTAGLLRLRTARINLDWAHTSLTFGQEAPLFSPLSPTSYATVLEPAMSWSGNLWVWTPGVTVTQRVDVGSQSSLVLQGGILDPLTEETPVFQGRNSTAGEATRAPGIAGRIAYERVKDTQFPVTIGFGGYRAEQRYQTFADIASWTLNSAIKAGLGKHIELSGEWYEGQAVGGLGGGIWTSVVFPEPAAPNTAIHPLRSVGGWGQMKVIPSARTEINAAFGQDENFGRDLRFFPFSFTAEGFPPMKKNRTELVNFVYKPNANLLFAFEYRHLFTVGESGWTSSGDHLNLAAGVRF